MARFKASVTRRRGLTDRNRNVFNDRLNCPRLSHRLKLSGSVFHRRGPTAAKHRSPKLLYVQRTTHFAVSAER